LHRKPVRGFPVVGCPWTLAPLACRGNEPTIEQNGNLEYVLNAGPNPKRDTPGGGSGAGLYHSGDGAGGERSLAVGTLHLQRDAMALGERWRFEAA